jgi:hypothetical protein
VRVGLGGPSDQQVLLDGFFDEMSDLGQADRADRPRLEHARLPEKRLADGSVLLCATAAESGQRDRDHPEADRLREQLDRARSLVIIEPTCAQLAYLDGLLDLGDRIAAEGLNVLVAGPPTTHSTDCSAAYPAWMPCHSIVRKSGEPEPLRVHRDYRLYVSCDDSRVMRFTVPGDADYRPLDAQHAVVSGLFKKLGIEAADRPPAPRHRTFGSDKPVFGLLDPEDDEQPRRITAYPMTSYQLPGRENDLGGEGLAETLLKDVLPGQLAFRIQGLTRDDDGPMLRFLRPGDLYPNTLVLLFVTDLPQVAPSAEIAGALRRAIRPAAASNATKEEQVTWSSDLPDDVADLAAMGVRVLVVRVRQELPDHAEFLAKEGNDLAGLLSVRSPVREEPADLVTGTDYVAQAVLDCSSKAAAEKSASEVVTKALAMLKARSPGTLRLGAGGRVVDNRVRDGARAPDEHLVLQLHDTSIFRPAQATIADSGEPFARHRELPAVVGWSVGEGQVTALAYSPFARDVWTRDAGKATWLRRAFPQEPRIEGWGVQRLLDLQSLGGAVRPFPATRLLLKDAKALDDGATIQIDCWARFGKGAWPLPSLVDAEGGRTWLQLAALDPLDQSVQFRMRATDRMLGAYTLSDVGGTKGTRIFVDLQPTTAHGRDVGETLASLAGLTGGGVVDRSSKGDPCAFEEPAPVAVLLAFVVLFLFSPFVRPWTAFLLALRRWWRRRTGDDDEEAGARLDVETFLVEWGQNPGDPKSGRIAGLPGGEKRFESGDYLSSARPATLFPFTAMRHTIGLPQQLPLVRLRYTTRSLDALILVDTSPGLRVPAESRNHTKSEFAEFFAGVIAGVVWQQGGGVAATSTARGDRRWGPSSGSGDLDSFCRFVRQEIDHGSSRHRATRLRFPDQVQRGQVVFLISDMLSPRLSDVREFVQKAANEGIELRIAHLFDPDETHLLGLVRDANTGAVYDRSEIDAVDLRRFYQDHVDRIAALVRQEDGIIVRIDTGTTMTELAELLAASRFFE